MEIRHHIGIVLLFLLALGTSAASLAQAVAAPKPTETEAKSGIKIQILMDNFPDDAGLAIVSLHSDSDSFPSAARAPVRQSVKIKDRRALAIFKHVKPGTYAVAVFHDKNMDGKLGFSWWPYPHTTEYAGVSRNQHPRWGPPKFSKAKFVVKDQDLTLKIKLIL